MKKLKLFVSFLSIVSLLLLPVTPVLALGEVDLGTTAAAPTVTTETTTPEAPTATTETTTISTDTSTPTTTTDTNTTVGDTTVSTDTSINSASNTSITVSDTTPPVITNIISASVLPTEATVAWVTNELAVSHFRYGTTTSYGSTVTLGASGALIHAATMLHLTAGTTYYYCLDATDLFNNTSESCGHSFVTATEVLQANTNPPTISSVTIAPITTTSATLSWTTDQLANGYVEYGTTENYGLTTQTDNAYTLVDTATISSLLPNTTYHYRITAYDEIGNTISTPDETFMTEALAGTGEVILTAPGETVVTPSLLISGVESSFIGEDSVTITWTTDLPSNSQVEFGDSINLGSETIVNSTLTTNHSVSISNLIPDTNYIFHVKSKPLGATVAVVSNLHEFSTLITPIYVTTPATITSLSSRVEGNVNATDILWSTDMNVTGQVEYGLDTAYGEINVSSGNELLHVSSLSNLMPNTTYHFRVKALNYAGDITYSGDQTFSTVAYENEAPNPASVTESSTENANSLPETVIALPITHPTLINGTGLDSQIVFFWNNPNETSFARTIIVRKTGSYPTSPTDGTTIYESDSETFTDTNVTNGTMYYYAFYSYDHARNYSTPVRVSLSPSAPVGDLTSSSGGSGGSSSKSKGAGSVEQIVFHETPVIISAEAAEHFTSLWKKGDQHLEIEHVQHVLALDGELYPTTNIDGKFGSITEKGLKQFQAKYNLPITGVTDVATQKQLSLASQSLVTLSMPGDERVLQANLKRGDTGEVVKNLQHLLADEGSHTDVIDGKFGRKTETSVRAFQLKYFIQPPNGFVGPKTRHMLKVLTGL